MRVELSSSRSEKTDERVLRVLLDCLHSLGKSCRIRVGASLAYLTFDPLREDEDLKLIVRGVAYEPECGGLGEPLTRQ